MSDYHGVPLEDINHKLDAILKGQAAMAHMPGAVARLQDDLTDVKLDVTALKAAVKDLSHQHSLLTARVTRIEAVIIV